jgi:hypothetical protein
MSRNFCKQSRSPVDSGPCHDTRRTLMRCTFSNSNRPTIGGSSGLALNACLKNGSPIYSAMRAQYDKCVTVWSVGELMHLTRCELCALSSRLENVLPSFEVGTVERSNALVSLENIRRVMLMRELRF